MDAIAFCGLLVHEIKLRTECARLSLVQNFDLCVCSAFLSNTDVSFCENMNLLFHELETQEMIDL